MHGQRLPGELTSMTTAAGPIINRRTWRACEVSAHVAGRCRERSRTRLSGSASQPVHGSADLEQRRVDRGRSDAFSGKGEIEVTAVMLMNTKIVRADGFYKQQTKHS